MVPAGSRLEGRHDSVHLWIRCSPWQVLQHQSCQENHLLFHRSQQPRISSVTYLNFPQQLLHQLTKLAPFVKSVLRLCSWVYSLSLQFHHSPPNLALSWRLVDQILLQLTYVLLNSSQNYHLSKFQRSICRYCLFDLPTSNLSDADTTLGLVCSFGHEEVDIYQEQHVNQPCLTSSLISEEWTHLQYRNIS